MTTVADGDGGGAKVETFFGELTVAAAVRTKRCGGGRRRDGVMVMQCGGRRRDWWLGWRLPW